MPTRPRAFCGESGTHATEERKKRPNCGHEVRKCEGDLHGPFPRLAVRTLASLAAVAASNRRGKAPHNDAEGLHLRLPVPPQPPRRMQHVFAHALHPPPKKVHAQTSKCGAGA